MAATIKLKRGTSTPSTSDIANGEVAVDTSAAKLYINDSGTVKEIGGGGGGGVTSDAQYNTVAGTNAGDDFTGTSATKNTLFGYDAGTAITSGDDNTAIGYQALRVLETGNRNVAIGYEPLYTTTSGGYNVAIGQTPLRASTSSVFNVAIGNNVGSALTSGSSNNVLIGNGAGLFTQDSSNNVAIGFGALGNSGNNIDGNVVIGYSAGAEVTDINNVIIGRDAGFERNSVGVTLAHGQNNVIIGYNAAPSTATTDNEVTLGNASITKFRVPGVNFVVKDTTATEDYVLTVDANGEAGWEAASGGGGTPTAITVADESSDTTCFPLFATAATGDLAPKSGSNLTFNSSSGALTATLLNGGAGDDLSLDFGSVA